MSVRQAHPILAHRLPIHNHAPLLTRKTLLHMLYLLPAAHVVAILFVPNAWTIHANTDDQANIPFEAAVLLLPANRSSERAPLGALSPSSPGAVMVMACSDSQPARRA